MNRPVLTSILFGKGTIATASALLSPRLIRRLLFVLLGLGFLHLFAAAAVAAGSGVEVSSTLQANFMYDLVADRTRLIQVSLVVVALGCAFGRARLSERIEDCEAKTVGLSAGAIIPH